MLIEDPTLLPRVCAHVREVRPGTGEETLRYVVDKIRAEEREALASRLPEYLDSLSVDLTPRQLHLLQCLLKEGT